MDSNTPGIYQIIYTKTDAAGNAAEPVVRTIHVHNSNSHGDSNTFPLDTTDSGTGGNTGIGDSNTFALDTTNSGTGGDSGHGDSNTFSLDTTNAGTGGSTGIGDSNTFTLDTTNSGTGGDSGHGDSNPFPLDTTDANQAPQLLSDGNRTVLENEKFVFELYASDPDGDILTWSTDGGYDSNWFEINATTGEISFLGKDYENPQDADQNNTYEVTIRATDSKGLHSNQTIRIQIEDVLEDIDGDGIEDAFDDDRDGDGISNEDELLAGTDPDNPYSLTNKPILRTDEGILDENGSIHLTGNVQFDGDGIIEDFGFVISSGISIDRSKSTVYWVRAVGNPEKFRLKVTESPYPDVMYFRAWAKNAAGYGIGPVKKVKIPEPPKFWWGEITEEVGGWKSSPWFGTFIYYQKGWLYHAQLGWLYSSSNEGESVWLWNENHGWLWTKEGVWPSPL